MKQILLFFAILFISSGAFSQKNTPVFEEWKGTVFPLNNASNRLIVDTFLLNNIESDDTLAVYTTATGFALGHNSYGDKG